ncbi:MAG: hypothetical protein LUD01_00480 [Clostridiales bacterium]|nr:hypothetical protein [Clostridiales bacterium]
MEFSICWNEIHRNVVNISKGPAWVAYICMGGSGCSVQRLNTGDSWPEGADELIGVYPSEAEARMAIEKYMERMLKS